MTSRPSTAAPILAVLAIALCAGTPPSVQGDEPPAKALPKDIEQILAWLPMDTESLVVARSFEMGKGLAGWVDAKIVDLKPLFFDQSLTEFRLVNDLLEPQAEIKIKLAVAGGRNAEVVSVFSSIRKESCSIVVLEKPLDDDARKWKEVLRAKAAKSRTMLDHEVFVFPSFIEMDGPRQPKEWQGTYIVVLSPDTILCATSDRYLEQLLQRRKSPGEGRALPADLPEWKLIDPTSPAWMLWRPAADKEPGIHGGGWMWRDDVAELIYVPEGDIAELEKAWHERWDDKRIFPRPPPGKSLTQRRGGALVVPLPTREVEILRAFPFAIGILGAFEANEWER